MENETIIDEIRRISHENPCGCSTIFKHSRKDLGDYIIKNTPLLSDKYYKMNTKIYWIVNGLTDFPKCKVCGRPILRNIAKLGNPQYEYCSKQCIVAEIKADPQKRLSTLNNAIRSKYGFPQFKDIAAEVLFWFKACRHNLFFQFIQAKENLYMVDWICSQTPLLVDDYYNLKTKMYWIINGIKDFPKCYTCGKPIMRNVFNITTGYHIEKTKHDCIFCSRSCVNSNKMILRDKEKTCLQRYNVKNVSFDPKIRNSGIRPYFYNDMFFDSSLELGYYVWLTDRKIRFEFQPKDKTIKYLTDDGKEHVYHPDFFLIDENKLQDTKGANNFDSNGYPIRNNWQDWHEKYQCMVEHGVEIIMENSEFMRGVMRYCTEKFGKKTWYRDYKYEKQIVNINRHKGKMQ